MVMAWVSAKTLGSILLVSEVALPCVSVVFVGLLPQAVNKRAEATAVGKAKCIKEERRLI